jgi:cell wall-associated NlpC family hydrolase
MQNEINKQTQEINRAAQAATAQFQQGQLEQQRSATAQTNIIETQKLEAQRQASAQQNATEHDKIGLQRQQGPRPPVTASQVRLAHARAATVGLPPLVEDDPLKPKTVPPPAGFSGPMQPPPPAAAPTGDFDYNMVPLPPPVTQPLSPPEAIQGPPSGTQDPAKVRTFAQGVVNDVMQEEGKPYSGPAAEIPGPDADRWGTPGWDCSSLVAGVFAKQGVKLTPYTDAAYDQTFALEPADQKAGDIVFYKYDDPSQPGVAYPHMGIYLGNGFMADASYSNGKVVVRKLLDEPYEIRRPTALRAS